MNIVIYTDYGKQTANAITKYSIHKLGETQFSPFTWRKSWVYAEMLFTAIKRIMKFIHKAID
jgi:hypothetical protein